MGKKPINEVLASNLAHFMAAKSLNQTTLSKKAKVAQRTVGNYLRPELRQANPKTGKAPSAKLTELESIAAALEVEVWELLRPLTKAEREFYAQIEESFLKLRKIAPDVVAADVERTTSDTPPPSREPSKAS